MFSLKSKVTSFLLISSFLTLNEGRAEDLFIKADGNQRDPVVTQQFEGLKGKATSADRHEVALSLFKLAELYIDGYTDDGFTNGRSALANLEQALALLDKLPKDESNGSRGVSENVLRELTRTRVAVIQRLTKFYLREEIGTGPLHACDFKQVEKAKALQKSILGKQKHWYKPEDHAEAYFQLAGLSKKGSKKFFKYLEKAAAYKHVGAIAALAEYSQEKADNLQHAITEVVNESAPLTQEEFNRQAFSNFAWTQGQRVKKLFLDHDSRFSKDQFLSYAAGRLIKEEDEHSLARKAAFKRKCEGGLMEGYHVVPESLYVEEARRHQLRVGALARFEVMTLAGLYQEEALENFKRAASLGNIEVCLSQGEKYSKLEGLSKVSYDKLAVHFYAQGAKHDDAECWLRLGRLFEQGRGTEKSDMMAIDCYIKSSDLGNYYAGRQLDRLGWKDRNPLNLVKFDRLEEDSPFAQPNDSQSPRLLRQSNKEETDN